MGQQFERQQLPLRLASAMTIHKCQGLTLKKTWVDLGPSEKTSLSRVKKIEDIVVEPMTLERLQAPQKLTNLKYRLQEEKRLHTLSLTSET